MPYNFSRKTYADVVRQLVRLYDNLLGKTLVKLEDFPSQAYFSSLQKRNKYMTRRDLIRDIIASNVDNFPVRYSRFIDNCPDAFEPCDDQFFYNEWIKSLPGVDEIQSDPLMFVDDRRDIVRDYARYLVNGSL